ncbi:MAG: lytic transglycosylase domain-containing protein [Rhodobacteraceae bacterium]|nr:lytic transglycosylase domain-containing protein [Paracoccaceae bacterium]
MLAASGAVADTPAPFPDFQAKRVKPPAEGSARRITIQIAPEAPGAAPSAAPAVTAPQEAGAGRYGWFWDRVSPDLAQSGPGRLEPALQAIAAQADGMSTPRLQQLQEVARSRGIAILRATVGTQVSPALVLAVISVESSGRADAISTAGAQGLMQLMPDTAARFGVTDALAADDNILGGVRYLNWLMERFSGDPILVLAGYNAGEGAVRDHAGVPPYAETRDYVPKVLAAFQVAKGLCRTPPELISDGCVFHTMN